MSQDATMIRNALLSPAAVMAPTQATDPHSHAAFDTEAAGVLTELHNAFAALLAACPAPTNSCAEVEAALGIDAMLAWQVLRIARVTDPFDAGIKVPGRAYVGKLLKSAARHKVPENVIARISRASDGYERLVAKHAGTRAEFEMMVSAYLPEARQKAELAGKQAAYKGMTQIRGVAAEADFTAYFWYPSEDEALVNGACIEGHLGVRRIRPGAPIYFTDGVSAGKDAKTLSLNRDPLDSSQGALLPEFSSTPLPEVIYHSCDDTKYCSVLGQDIGLRSAIDLVRGTMMLGLWHRHRVKPDRTLGGSVKVLEIPAKRLTLDIFLHRDIYPGVHLELSTHDISSGKITVFNDPAREHQRLHVSETIQSLGQGFARAKLTHVPRYMEMLEYTASKIGLSPADFRGHRVDIQYPVYGAQYTFVFRMPDPPAAK